MSEEIFVPNATNVLKKVLVCSPKYYVLNAINEITKSWMEKGETEQNDRMVSEWNELIQAYEENGVEVAQMTPDKNMQVETPAVRAVRGPRAPSGGRSSSC